MRARDEQTSASLRDWVLVILAGLTVYGIELLLAYLIQQGVI